MRRAAIVAPVRTPVAKFLGSLQAVPVEDLAAAVVRATIERAGLDPARIDDVVFAQSYANGETPCVGRWAALQAGLPIEVPGMQLDRRCGGGLQAVAMACSPPPQRRSSCIPGTSIGSPACSAAQRPTQGVSPLA